MAENGFCPEWIAQNWDRYVDPFFQHVLLTVVSVVIGFAIAAVMAVVAHRRRRLNGPLVGLTEVLYTIPSPAAFLLLLPFTGFGTVSGGTAATAYSPNAMIRSMVTGLAGVPEDIKDAARGMGLTDHQLLWKVELPLALPEIFAGLRIASVTTVGLATLAFLAGAGGLGESIEAQISFKSNVVVAGGLCVLLAVALDLLILSIQKASTPWTRARLT
ncbi:MAG: ABC transporter permease [Solirubrobacteraceae bacterium]